MTDASAAPDEATDPQPTIEQDALSPNGAAPPPVAPVYPGDRPELAVVAAFAGGLTFARLLKRLAR